MARIGCSLPTGGAGGEPAARLGTHALAPPCRAPVVTATMAPMLDPLSGGRIDLGGGVGRMRAGPEAPGGDDRDRRGAVTDEQMRRPALPWAEGRTGIGRRPRPIAGRALPARDA